MQINLFGMVMNLLISLIVVTNFSKYAQGVVFLFDDVVYFDTQGLIKNSFVLVEPNCLDPAIHYTAYLQI